MHHLTSNVEKETVEGLLAVISRNGFGDAQACIHLAKGVETSPPTVQIDGDTYYKEYERETDRGLDVFFTRGIHIGDKVRPSSTLKSFVVQDIQVREDGQVLVCGVINTGTLFKTPEPILMIERESSDPVASCPSAPNNLPR